METWIPREGEGRPRMDRLQYESLINDATSRTQASIQISAIARTFARKIVPLYRTLGIRWNGYFPRHDQIVEVIRYLAEEFRKTPGLKSIAQQGVEISMEAGCWRLRFVYGLMGAIENKKGKEKVIEHDAGIEQRDDVIAIRPGGLHKGNPSGLSEGEDRPHH